MIYSIVFLLLIFLLCISIYFRDKILKMKKIKKSKQLNYMHEFLRIIALVLGTILVGAYLMLMYGLCIFVIYIILFIPIEFRFGINNGTYYFVLTFTMIFLTFLPQKILLYIYNLPAIILDSSDKKLYFGFINLIDVKSIIFFIALLFALISNGENLYGKILIDYKIWDNIKPVINQSVLTFIAYDRFHKSFESFISNNKEKIKEICYFYKIANKE